VKSPKVDARSGVPPNKPSGGESTSCAGGSPEPDSAAVVVFPGADETASVAPREPSPIGVKRTKRWHVASPGRLATGQVLFTIVNSPPGSEMLSVPVGCSPRFLRVKSTVGPGIWRTTAPNDAVGGSS